ncbi:MAG: DUF2189 domain-containing protein [Gammaproteobacteria bacterium]|nr:DUF2189 domain-containing protein [Gammaproteobacteria bacterium]
MPSHIQEITLDHPWQWIASGWNDFKRAPKVSVAYGMIFFITSILLTLLVFSSDFFFLVPPLTAGFFLVAPIMAVFLYDMSRRLEKGQSTSFKETCKNCQQNTYNLIVMGMVLLVVMIFWMMIANLVFAIFFSEMVTFDNLLPTLFLSGDSPAFLAAGIISGGIIAFGVFAITVISIPMLIDRNTNVPNAITTSYKAVLKNPRPLMLWAALIVMFVMMGILTFYIGFIISMPIIGYATWHAYSDLVVHEEEA